MQINFALILILLYYQLTRTKCVRAISMGAWRRSCTVSENKSDSFSWTSCSISFTAAQWHHTREDRRM